jgi:hypothetical protein
MTSFVTLLFCCCGWFLTEPPPNKNATRPFLPVAQKSPENKNGHGLFGVCAVTVEASLKTRGFSLG